MPLDFAYFCVNSLERAHGDANKPLDKLDTNQNSVSPYIKAGLTQIFASAFYSYAADMYALLSVIVDAYRWMTTAERLLIDEL